MSIQDDIKHRVCVKEKVIENIATVAAANTTKVNDVTRDVGEIKAAAKGSYFTLSTIGKIIIFLITLVGVCYGTSYVTVKTMQNGRTVEAISTTTINTDSN